MVTVTGNRHSICPHPALQARHWWRVAGRLSVALALTALGWLPMAPGRAVHAAVTRLPAPVFPGPQFGAAATSGLTLHDFSYQCTVGITTAPVVVAGTTIAAGGAMTTQGCGQATLLLNHPATGQFQARIALPSTAAAGTKAGLELLVQGAGGYNIHSAVVTATPGPTRTAAVDVAGGVALTIIPLSPSVLILYQPMLTGQARALRPVSLAGTGMPAGVQPVPKAAISLVSFANPATAASTISGVSVPVAGTYLLGGNGVIGVRLPAHAAPTFAVRVGTDDTRTAYNPIAVQLSLRVLDAGGRLLRKAIALTYSGSGLQSLWVDTRGGSTVQLTDDLGPHVVATSFSFLPTRYAPHPNPDHEEFGSPSGGAISISPDAFLAASFSAVGNSDTTVAGQTLPRYTYLEMDNQGLAELIMTKAHGRFQARFAIASLSSQPNLTHTATLTVLDQNSHPLVKVSVTAKPGTPGAVLSVPIDGGSILEARTTGQGGALYDMTLTGHATLYDRIFPPSEPPVSTPGGTAIDPRAFTLSGILQVATQDTLLIHQAALEQWSLAGGGGGLATLNLAALPGRHHLFSALYGLTLVNQNLGIGHLHLTVMAAGGKVVRTVKATTRAGYGPRRVSISLAGGARLQIAWDDVPLTVYALTAT